MGADLDQMTQVESILGLLDLQDYFTNKKYPYLFYNTLSDAKITNPDVQLLFDKIDKKNINSSKRNDYESSQNPKSRKT